MIPGNTTPVDLLARDEELQPVPVSTILQNHTLGSSPGSSLKQGRARGDSSSLAHTRLSTKTSSRACHQPEMAPGDIAAVTSEQPYPQEPGFFIQLQPSVTSLLNACGVHNYRGEGPRLRSCLICVKDQEQNKPKKLQKDRIAKASPPGGSGRL